MEKPEIWPLSQPAYIFTVIVETLGHVLRLNLYTLALIKHLFRAHTFSSSVQNHLTVSIYAVKINYNDTNLTRLIGPGASSLTFALVSGFK